MTNTNLVKNAVEHVAELKDQRMKTVRMTAEVENGEIVVTINNRGEPVPPEHLAAFFYKFNSDRKKKGGAGPGAPYASLVVRAPGGRIAVKSNAKDGTTLTVGLPVHS